MPTPAATANTSPQLQLYSHQKHTHTTTTIRPSDWLNNQTNLHIAASYWIIQAIYQSRHWCIIATLFCASLHSQVLSRLMYLGLRLIMTVLYVKTTAVFQYGMNFNVVLYLTCTYSVNSFLCHCLLCYVCRIACINWCTVFSATANIITLLVKFSMKIHHTITTYLVHKHMYRIKTSFI